MAKARLKITVYVDLDVDRDYRSTTPRGRYNFDRKAFEAGTLSFKELMARTEPDSREVKWRLFTDEQLGALEGKPAKKGAVTKKVFKPVSKGVEKVTVATKKKATPVLAKKKVFSFKINK